MSVLAEHRPSLGARLPDASVLTLVCDAHAASRIGLGVILNRQTWVSRCVVAPDRDEAVTLTGRFKPDAAIVDVSDAGPFVASYIAPLRAARPVMAILLSSRCRLPATAPHSTAGAVGVLSPGFTVEELTRTVSSALVGDASPRLAGLFQVGGLTERQREVLQLMSTGATNREIAAAMHVGPETVKKHAEAVYRKLGVRNRTEAAQRAAELLSS
ncbi:MAG TPA: response regulator transcription factor [Solirubrobacteraceae bacterium]|nr:response regulator transcription factor [Solirubrobacteraceae bacterium]